MKNTLVMFLALMLAGCSPQALGWPTEQPTQAAPTVTAQFFQDERISTPTPEKVRRSDFCTVTASRLNVRTGPGTNYPAVSWLRSGETVSITTQAGNWYETPAGWIHKSYCEKE